jgi:hypothetical protein
MPVRCHLMPGPSFFFHSKKNGPGPWSSLLLS